MDLHGLEMALCVILLSNDLVISGGNPSGPVRAIQVAFKPAENPSSQHCNQLDIHTASYSAR